MKIAFLGTGAMGSLMATNLRTAGHDVVVWNRTKDRTDALAAEGIGVAATPAQAVAGSDLAISMVTDDAASRAVWLDGPDAALPALGADTVVIESSTVSPAHSLALGAALERAGVRFLEGPVLGSRPQAAAGQLVYLLGGPQSVVDSVRDVLGATAGAIHHTGPVGSAAAMKLGVNGLLAIQVAAVAEIVGFLERSGIDRAKAVSILDGLPLTAPAVKRVLGLLLTEQFAPNFPVALVAKDTRYLVQAAHAVGAGTTMSGAVASEFAAALDDGFGDLDISGVAKRHLSS